MRAAKVIWCTGLVPDLSWIDRPFLGSLSSALLGGVGSDASRIAAHIAGHIATGAAMGSPATQAM